MPKIGGKRSDQSYFVGISGHWSEAFLLSQLAGRSTKSILWADNYAGMSDFDRLLWKERDRLQNGVDGLLSVPIVRSLLRGIANETQVIPRLYPVRDHSAPSAMLRQEYFLIRQKGLMKSLIEGLAEDPRPIVTTSPMVAFAAEEFGYHEQVTVVLAGERFLRSTAPLNPKKSSVEYVVESHAAMHLLERYGVRQRNISLIGDGLLASRESFGLGRILHTAWNCHTKKGVEDALRFVNSMSRDIRGKKLRVRLFAGTSEERLVQLRVGLSKARMNTELNKGNIEIIWDADVTKYLAGVQKAAGKTDIVFDRLGAMNSFKLEDIVVINDYPEVEVAHEWMKDWAEDGEFEGRFEQNKRARH